MSIEKTNSFEQPPFQPQQYWLYDATGMPLTEDLVPADSSQSYDIYPDANKPALSAIREVLDYRAWRTRRLEKSQLIAKRQRVVKQLSERDAYLSRLFR